MEQKYEEMKVIRQVIQSYANSKKIDYQEIIEGLKERAKDFPQDINSNQTESELSSILWRASSILELRNDYQKALSVIREFDNAMFGYEQAYTEEQIKPGGIAEQQIKDSKRMFYSIQTQNTDYKNIMNEIALSLWGHDPHIDGLEMGYETKVNSLEEEFEAGRISQEELIYYTHMCLHLSQNPTYIESISEYQPAQPPQGMNK